MDGMSRENIKMKTEIGTQKISILRRNREMFDFRIVNTPDGNQIIDRNLKTPYSALTPVQMVEYTEIDNNLAFMDRQKQKQRKQLQKEKLPFAKALANAMGLF